MVEHVTAPAGGLDHQHDPLLDFHLADEFVEIGWPQGDVEVAGRGAGGLLVVVFAHRGRGGSVGVEGAGVNMKLRVAPGSPGQDATATDWGKMPQP